MLVVEDVHWADDATLDVLGYAARRIEALGAVLVLTFRDDEIDAAPSAAAAARRAGRRARSTGSRSQPLSRDGGRAAGGRHRARRRRAAPRHAAATRSSSPRRSRRPPTPCPATRRRRGAGARRAAGPGLPRGARAALASCRRRVGATSPRALLGRAAATRWPRPSSAGVIEVRPDGLAFRHELARRAIERSLPAIRRRRAQRRGRRGAARDRARRSAPALMHHAVEAGDVGDGRRGRPERRARGRRGRLAPPGARALRGRARRTCDAAGAAPSAPRCSTSTAGSSTTRTASARPSPPAARRRGCTSELGDPVGARASASCACRATCSWPARPTRPRHARRAGGRDARADRATAAALAARARCYEGAILALTDEPPRAADDARARTRAGHARRPPGPRRAVPELPRHRARRARRPGRPAAAAREHRGGARRAPARVRRARLLQPRRDALRAAATSTSSSACVRDGLALRPRARLLVARLQPRGPPLRGCCVRRGRWDAGAGRPARARRGRRGPGDAVRLQRAVARAPARPPRRRGRAGACSPPRGSTRGASGCCSGVAYAGLAVRRVGVARRRPHAARRRSPSVLLPRTAHPGAAPFRGELLRYLARAGVPAEPFDGCPEPWAAGLRGDWRAAAAGLGDGRRSVRAGARAGRVGRAGADARGAAHPRRARRERRGRARPRAAARAGRARAARPARAARAPTRPGSPSASWPCSSWSARG